MEIVFQFLSELKQNNNREWFRENKDRYQRVKSTHENIVSEMISLMSTFDREINLLKPSDCIFRIYRDVRFSKNKEPFKTAIGAFFARGGKQSKFAGYYLHIEPENSFIGGGLWQPQAEVLKLVRKEIYYNSTEFKSLLENQNFKNTFGKLWDEKLKKAPKDFPADFQDIEFLKYKSYVIGHKVEDNFFMNKNVGDKVFKFFEIMQSYINFLNRGIEDYKA